MSDYFVRNEIRRFLTEDIGYGDITSDLICGDEEIRCHIIAKEDFVVSGLEESALVFEELGASWTSSYSSGDPVKEGDILMEVRGSTGDVLAAERLALNILMRMSGIATEVSKMVSLAGETKVAATRKTTPGFRYFEKKAVVHGGGDPHRYRLDDMILIKDNHIKSAGGLENAISKAKKGSVYKKIEVEITSRNQISKAIESGVDIIMLDNMSPEEAKAAYEQIKDTDPHIMVEISGNINIDNIADYAPFADVVSSGAITHSIKSADISMNIISR